MDAGDPFGVVHREAGPQEVREQVVIAVPAAIIVEGNHEQVRPLEALQHRLTASVRRTACARRTLPGHPAALSHGIAQGAAQPFEETGPEQEGERGGSQARQHLLGHEVEQEAVAGAEPANHGACVRAIADRQAGELDGRGPALGQRHQRLDIRRVELHAESEPQEFGRFPGAETKVLGPDLQQGALRAKARQRERRVGARGDGQVRPLRQPARQQRHGLVHRRGRDDVIVIEHDDAGWGAPTSMSTISAITSPGLAREKSTGSPGRSSAAAVVAARTATQSPRRNTTGSLSAASSESQPAPPGHRESHWTSTVDLPNPGGAETTMSRGRGRARTRRPAVGGPRARLPGGDAELGGRQAFQN